MTGTSDLRYVKDRPRGPRGLAGAVSSLFSWIDAGAAAFLLIGSLLLINVIQCLSLLFYLFPYRPLSRWLVWKINREFAGLWWGFLVFWAVKWKRVQVEILGDELPYGENVLLIANHQQMPDIPVLMTIALKKGRLGDMKWFVKDSLKYVPGIGWGMYFLGCVFLKRNWYADYANIQKTFSRLRELGMPFWLVSFVEGTRIQPHKLRKAQDFARTKGYPIPSHTLIPKRKGFVTAIQGLGDRLDAVYDATIFYEEGIPTLSEMARGLCPRVKLHVRRFPLSALPRENEEALAEWLRQRFVEKEALLAFWENQARASE